MPSTTGQHLSPIARTAIGRSTTTAAEWPLRGIAVGRNNWTFFGSDNGGKTAAVLRTLVACCERVKIDPWKWFRDVLARIPSYPVNQLDDLLPHRWAPANQ